MHSFLTDRKVFPEAESWGYDAWGALRWYWTEGLSCNDLQWSEGDMDEMPRRYQSARSRTQ